MSVNLKNQEAISKLDPIKWMVGIAILAFIVWANSYYSHVAGSMRAAGSILLGLVSLFVLSTTEKGTWAVNFAKEAKIEFKKVIWPTRQEATQTSLVVLAFTVIMALILWGIDGIMVRIVSMLINL